jgi:hypothetical protein
VSWRSSIPGRLLITTTLVLAADPNRAPHSFMVLYYVVSKFFECCAISMNAQQLIALNIRRLRVAKGSSQDDLALIAGVERSYTGHLERGTKIRRLKPSKK